MKTRIKNLSFLGSMKAILFNQKGEVNLGSADSGDSGDSGSESSESSVEASSEESNENYSDESEDSENADFAAESSSEESSEIKAENDEEFEEEVQQAIEDGASEEEVKEMVRKYVLKVDGKEYVREIDVNNEEEMQKQLQMALKGQKSMQELAEIKKLYTQELQRLKADPFKVLKEMDPDFDPLAVSSKYIDELMAENEKSPEEKQREAELRELEELRAEKQKLEQERLQAQQEREMAALAQQIETDIMSALDSDPELIADKETVALVAQEMIWAEEKGLNIDAKMAISGVKEHLKRQFNNYSSRFKNPAALKEYMGDDLLSKLREERKAQAEKTVKNLNSIKSTAKTESKPAERKKYKISDLISGDIKF